MYLSFEALELLFPLYFFVQLSVHECKFFIIEGLRSLVAVDTSISPIITLYVICVLFTCANVLDHRILPAFCLSHLATDRT